MNVHQVTYSTCKKNEAWLLYRNNQVMLTYRYDNHDNSACICCSLNIFDIYLDTIKE